MRYLLINPFPSARRNGITTYIQTVKRHLEEHGIAATGIANDAELSPARYRERVRNRIVADFRPDDVLIEAPEMGAATLLLPPEYRVHVRLHTPTAFVARHNRECVNLKNFQDELRVADTAHVASSPSHALLRRLRLLLDVTRFHVR